MHILFKSSDTENVRIHRTEVESEETMVKDLHNSRYRQVIFHRKVLFVVMHLINTNSHKILLQYYIQYST